jgi:hypothetical protein
MIATTSSETSDFVLLARRAADVTLIARSLSAALGSSLRCCLLGIAAGGVGEGRA